MLACNEGLQRWKGKKAESITTKPLPSPEELNASVPMAEWEPGIDGKLKPPWAHVAIVYLIDPRTAGLFTYLNSTIGAHIAWDVLREKVRTMRALRGERVLALVRLSTRPMKTTNFGMKTRPEFEIVGWRLLGGGGGNVRRLRAKGDLRAEGNRELPAGNAFCREPSCRERAPLRRNRSLLRTRRSPSWRRCRFPPYRKRWTTPYLGDRSIVDARGATHRPSLFYFGDHAHARNDLGLRIALRR